MPRSRKYVRLSEPSVRNPQPNYSQFVAKTGAPQFIDEEGREYNLSTGTIKEKLIDSGEDQFPDFVTADQYESHYIGTKAFDVRLPITLRHHENPPDAALGNETIQLFELKTQVLCEGKIDRVYFDKKRATGWMVLRDFTTLGLAPNPGEWREQLKIRRRDPSEKYFDFDS